MSYGRGRKKLSIQLIRRHSTVKYREWTYGVVIFRTGPGWVNVHGNALAALFLGKCVLWSLDRKMFWNLRSVGMILRKGNSLPCRNLNPHTTVSRPAASSLYWMVHPGSRGVIQFAWPPSSPDPTPFKRGFLTSTPNTVASAHTRTTSAQPSYDNFSAQNRDERNTSYILCVCVCVCGRLGPGGRGGFKFKNAFQKP